MLNPEQMNGTVIFYAHKAMQLELIAAQLEQRAIKAEQEAAKNELELASLKAVILKAGLTEKELEDHASFMAPAAPAEAIEGA